MKSADGFALIRRNQFDSDLDEEMRLHRELREQEEIERGLSPKEAHYAAQRRFGNDLLLERRAATCGDGDGWITQFKMFDMACGCWRESPA